MTQDTDVNQQALSYARHQAAKSLSDLVALMRRTAADCAACLKGLSEAQASFPPQGEWSTKDVLAHILDATETVNRQIANLVAGIPATPVSGVGTTPGSDRPIEELRQEMAGLWAETARLVASLPEDGDRQATREHPWFGALNFREWIAFQRIHALDHIQQIEKIKGAPGYPAQ